MALSSVATFTSAGLPSGFGAILANYIGGAGAVGVALSTAAEAAIVYSTQLNAEGQEFQAAFSFSSYQTCAVFAKAQSNSDFTTNMYQVKAVQNGAGLMDTLSIIKRYSGVDSTLISSNLKRGKIATAHTIRIRCFDAGTHVIIQSWKDGILIDEYVDSTNPITGAGYAGVWLAANSSGMGVDNLQAGNITVKWVCGSAKSNPTQSVGNDTTGTGTFNAPYATVRKAVANTIMTAPGQVCMVRGGNYSQRMMDESDGFAWRSGTSWDNPTTIQGFPGEGFTVNNTSGYGVIQIETSNGYRNTGWIQFINMSMDGQNVVGQTGFGTMIRVAGGQRNIRFQRGDYSRAYYNNFGFFQRGTNTATPDLAGNNGMELMELRCHHTVASHGIYQDKHGTLVEYCEIDNNHSLGIWTNTVATPTDTYGVQCDGAIYRYNHFHHNGYQVVGFKGADNILIYGNIMNNNNTILDATVVQSYGISTPVNNSKHTTIGLEIYNNTMYENYHALIFAIGTTGIIVKNNIFYKQTVKGYTLGDENVTPTISNNLNITSGQTDGQNPETDPLFVSETNGAEDFHLQEASPCRGAGADLSGTFTVDYSGKPILTWDQGAIFYENPVTESGPTVVVPSGTITVVNTPVTVVCDITEDNVPRLLNRAWLRVDSNAIITEVS